MNYKVSVIIPVYNAEKCVEKAINSLLMQSYSNLEIIVVDDGSRDNSLSVCQSLAEKDERLRVFTQSNTGVSGARNMGLRVATGDLIMFVDADDWLPEDGIASLITIYEKFHCSVICGSYQLMKTRNRVLKMAYQEHFIDLKDLDAKRKSLILGLHCAPWAKVFEAERIRKYAICFPENIPYAEDGIFFYIYLKYAESVYISSKNVYYYNFTDSHSAARKYHVKYGHYLHQLMDAQLDFFQRWQCEESLVEELEHVYFARSLRHYILHEDCEKKVADRIQEAASLFPVAAKNSYWDRYIQKKQWSRLFLAWKLHNFKDYCLEKLKMMFL